MIRVFNIPAITWILTVVLLLGGSYHVLQATRSHQLTDRVNQSLHALMNVLMAAMLWNLVPSTMLAQIAVLAGAALWFVIQAVARPEFKTLCTGSQGRLKCVYHSLTMAGAALMVAMMGHVTTAGSGIVPAGGMSMPHAHHTIAAAPQSTAAATFDYLPDLAILLTIFFGAAAVVFLILLLRAATFDYSPDLAILLTIFLGAAAALFLVLLLRFRVTKTTHRHAATPRLSVRTEHGIEALGAAVMALMFATMSA